MYKYLRPERIDVLAGLKMRATPYDKLNDPFECIYNLEPLASEMKEAEADGFRAEWAQVKVFLDSIIGQYGVLCFSKRYDSMPMWAHYTDNHSGFVLELDESHKFFSTKAEYIEPNYRQTEDLSSIRGFGSLRDVSYTDERSTINLGDPVPFDAFFKKSKQWEYEEEVRTFRSRRECDSFDAKVSLLTLPPSAVTSVIAGLNSEPLHSKLKTIASKVAFSHVQFRIASLHLRKFTLTLTAL